MTLKIEDSVWEWLDEDAEPPADDVLVSAVTREIQEWAKYRQYGITAAEQRIDNAIEILTAMRDLI